MNESPITEAEPRRRDLQVCARCRELSQAAQPYLMAQCLRGDTHPWYRLRRFEAQRPPQGCGFKLEHLLAVSGE